jgi:hypothetical protein
MGDWSPHTETSAFEAAVRDRVEALLSSSRSRTQLGIILEEPPRLVRAGRETAVEIRWIDRRFNESKAGVYSIWDEVDADPRAAPDDVAVLLYSYVIED